MIVVTSESVSTITVDKLNGSHVIVGKIGSDLVILTDTGFQQGLFKWRVVNSSFTIGNAQAGAPYYTIGEAVRSYPKGLFHAFDKWQDALKWLLAQSSG